MSRQKPSNVVRFRPRNSPPPRRPKPPKGPLAIGLILLALAAIWLVSQYGERVGLPEQAVTAAQQIGRTLSPAMAPPPANIELARTADFTCRVDRVNDGDTVRCKDGKRIRLHGISARERDETCSQGHPCPAASARASTDTLKGLVSGKTLSCRNIGQSYERITAICWTPDYTEVNCAMVASGTAALWPRFHREFPICQATPEALKDA